MKILKSLTVSLFSFLLFIAVLAFGILFTINSTVLNPKFITDRIDSIDTVELMDEFVKVEGSQETTDLVNTIKEVVTEVEPVVKDGIGTAVDSVYDYLLGKRPEPDIKGTLKVSFLNSEFVASLLNDISLPKLMDTTLLANPGQSGMSEEFATTFKNVISEVEPKLKEQTAEMTGPVFDYILGMTQDIDLQTVARDTILNEELIVPLINAFDLSAAIEEVVSEMVVDQMPPETAFIADSVPDIVDNLEPAIKLQLTNAAGPFLDYLVGKTRDFSVTISLAPVIETLEDELKTELFASPPSAYAGLSRSELEQVYNTQLAGMITSSIPLTFEIDESILGPALGGNFSESLTKMETSLDDIRLSINDASQKIEEKLIVARRYVSYFQLAYILLIVFIALMVTGIILLLRDVKAITRKIGVPLLIYGALEYAGIWAGRYFLNGNLPIKDIPPALENWVTDLINAVIKPLEIFSLSLLVIGLILTIVSFVYRRKKQEPEVAETTV